MQLRVKNWAVGITTAPRSETTLAASVASLAEAGWDAPHLFAEPETQLDEKLRQLPVTWRQKRLGAFPNWYLALVELYLTQPRAEAYLLCQDDVVYARYA